MAYLQIIKFWLIYKQHTNYNLYKIINAPIFANIYNYIFLKNIVFIKTKYIANILRDKEYIYAQISYPQIKCESYIYV